MISRSGQHALQALTELARLAAGESAGAQSIAERIGAPGNYLGKLLQMMARRRLVTSRKGLGGGFRLARDAGSIRLIDVMTALDQSPDEDSCLLTGRPCSHESACAVHERWAPVRREFLDLLRTTTIADLAQTHGPELFGTGKLPSTRPGSRSADGGRDEPIP